MIERDGADAAAALVVGAVARAPQQRQALVVGLGGRRPQRECVGPRVDPRGHTGRDERARGGADQGGLARVAAGGGESGEHAEVPSDHALAAS